MFTPKQRMINAYKGIHSDRYPVAPEFWYYYPAKVLGANMIEFEREVPFWQALQITFKKYKTEGWGIALADSINPDVEIISEFKKINEKQYQHTNKTIYKTEEFHSRSIFDKDEPSWRVEYPVKTGEELDIYLNMTLSDKIEYDFKSANNIWQKVGEDYLVEFWLGVSFFDFIAGLMGFEKAIIYFMSENEQKLTEYRQRYIDFKKRLIKKVCLLTEYESFVIGNSYSNNSLLGPRLWRKWDKPYLKEIAEEVHKNGRLLHLHFHGKSMDTVADFAEVNLDCVCPFERPPGGDIKGIEGLKKVRKKLAGRVTMNGNVHTVESLIRGTTEDVRKEVIEIKKAFTDSPKLIIGTGDQVGRETPEENILAMVEEAKRK